MRLSPKAPKELRDTFGTYIGQIRAVGAGVMSVVMDGFVIRGWRHEFQHANISPETEAAIRERLEAEAAALAVNKS